MADGFNRLILLTVAAVLVVASCMLAAAAAAQAELQAEQQNPAWNMFRKQLFSNMDIDGGPQGVSDLLNRMKDILELNENSLEDGVKWEQRVDTLLDACEPPSAANGGGGCTANSLTELSRLIEAYSFGPFPVLNYLEKCRQSRFAGCREQLMASIQSNIERQLEPGEREYLEQVKDSIFESALSNGTQARFPTFPTVASINEGILDFVIERDERIRCHIKRKSKFVSEFSGSLLVKSCQKFLAAGEQQQQQRQGSPMEALLVMLSDGGIAQSITDPKTQSLIRVGQMCAHLRGRRLAKHAKSIYKLLKQRRKLMKMAAGGGKSKFCGLIGGGGGGKGASAKL